MLIHETAVYSKFVKYVRDVSSGRRVVTHGNILEFVTGTSEEPLLGFAKTPQIHFPVAEVKEPMTTDEVIYKHQVQVWVVFEKFFLYRIANIAGKMCKTGCGDESI